MLPSHDQLLGLVSQIYDAAGDASLWPTFLETFSNSVAATATGLMYHDMTALRPTMMVSARIDPQCEKLYIQHYGKCDLLRKAWLERFSQAGPDGVVTSEQVISPAQLQKTEYYNDFLVPNHVVHQFCGPVVVNKSWSAVLTCSRSSHGGPFETDAVTLLRQLLPHLQRAIYLHHKFTELQGKQRNSMDALDLLPTGVIIVGARARVLAMNRVASQILAQNDGLTLDKEGLKGSTSHETNKLRSSIAAACDHEAVVLSPGRCVKIARPSGKRPIALIIVRGSPHSLPLDTGRHSGIVFVSDPEVKPRAASQILIEMYGLTEAEARLAQQLIQGETLVRAAECLGISHNTARTHLQRIYSKTDTRHQGDLVRLLLCGSCVLKEEPADE